MPTQKTIELARERGWTIDSVERFNAYSGRTNDLFGFGDLMAMSGKHNIIIQTTSGSNVSARVQKIIDDCAEPAKRWIQGGGRILVIAWRKLEGSRKLQYREIEIRLFDGELGWEEF